MNTALLAEFLCVSTNCRVLRTNAMLSKNSHFDEPSIASYFSTKAHRISFAKPSSYFFRYSGIQCHACASIISQRLQVVFIRNLTFLFNLVLLASMYFAFLTQQQYTPCAILVYVNLPEPNFWVSQLPTIRTNSYRHRLLVTVTFRQGRGVVVYRQVRVLPWNFPVQTSEEEGKGIEL